MARGGKIDFRYMQPSTVIALHVVSVIQGDNFRAVLQQSLVAAGDLTCCLRATGKSQLQQKSIYYIPRILQVAKNAAKKVLELNFTINNHIAHSSLTNVQTNPRALSTLGLISSHLREPNLTPPNNVMQTKEQSAQNYWLLSPYQPLMKKKMLKVLTSFFTDHQ